jgi:hypothetical protein
LKKDGLGLKGTGTGRGKKKPLVIFSPNFFSPEVFKNGGTGRQLVDGAGEERVGSSGNNP